MMQDRRGRVPALEAVGVWLCLRLCSGWALGVVEWGVVVKETFDDRTLWRLIEATVREAAWLGREARRVADLADDEWPEDFDANDIPLLYFLLGDLLAVDRSGEAAREVHIGARKSLAILLVGIRRQLADAGALLYGDERMTLQAVYDALAPKYLGREPS